YALATADLNNDRRPDLVSASFNFGNLNVVLNPGLVNLNFLGTFSGDGGNLTGLNASQLSSGTVSLARLPVQVVTNTQTGVTLGGTFSGSFTGNGSGLTNLNAGQLTGQVPLSALPSVAVTNNQTGITLSGTFSGNGAGLTNLPVGANGITNTQTGVTLGGAFNGNGVGLTNLNAGQLTGQVPLSSLPAIVMTNNQTGVTLSGTFVGNGAGLTNLNASAITSGTLPLAQLPGSVLTNNASGITLSGTFSGNGSALANIGLSNVNGAITSNTTWSVVGNRASGFNNPVVVIQNSSTNANAGPALRVLVDGGNGSTPDGALSVSANVLPNAANSLLARFGNASSWVAAITNDGTIYANGFVGNGTGTFTGNGGGLTNLNANSIVGGLTTNLSVTTPTGTKTLFFTNGVLRAVQ
ncbi:MAG: hypothetical protein JWM68_1202, partial [Verrucomicrobiales bacterium]|nr:hypothetical protein [Verrucomicrobiales bacterium]